MVTVIDAEEFHQSRRQGNERQRGQLDQRRRRKGGEGQRHSLDQGRQRNVASSKAFIDTDAALQDGAAFSISRTVSGLVRAEGGGYDEGWRKIIHGHQKASGARRNSGRSTNGKRRGEKCKECDRCCRCGGQVTGTNLREEMSYRDWDAVNDQSGGRLGPQEVGGGYRSEQSGNTRSPRRLRRRREEISTNDLSARGRDEVICLPQGRNPDPRREWHRSARDGGGRRESYGKGRHIGSNAREGGYPNGGYHQWKDESPTSLTPRWKQPVLQFPEKGHRGEAHPGGDYASIPPELIGQPRHSGNPPAASTNIPGSFQPKDRRGARRERTEREREDIDKRWRYVGDGGRTLAGGGGERHLGNIRQDRETTKVCSFNSRGGRRGADRSHNLATETQWPSKIAGGEAGQGRLQQRQIANAQDRTGGGRSGDQHSTSSARKAPPPRTKSRIPNSEHPSEETSGFGLGDRGCRDGVEERRLQQAVNRNQWAGRAAGGYTSRIAQPSAPNKPVPAAGHAISPPRLQRIVNLEVR